MLQDDIARIFDQAEYLGLTRKWLALNFDDTAKGEQEIMF